MAESYEFTVYRGTFIQLSRVDVSRSKPELVRNRGALWVSSSDGRIKGFDWQARDDASFQELMSRNGWVDVDAAVNGNGTGVTESTVKVKLVIATEDRNEFFFPGFIGMYYFLFTQYHTLTTPRYPYTRASIPECRAIWLFHSSRLARNIHLPRGVRIWL